MYTHYIPNEDEHPPVVHHRSKSSSRHHRADHHHKDDEAIARNRRARNDNERDSPPPDWSSPDGLIDEGKQIYTRVGRGRGSLVLNSLRSKNNSRSFDEITSLYS